MSEPVWSRCAMHTEMSQVNIYSQNIENIWTFYYFQARQWWQSLVVRMRRCYSTVLSCQKYPSSGQTTGGSPSQSATSEPWITSTPTVIPATPPLIFLNTGPGLLLPRILFPNWPNYRAGPTIVCYFPDWNCFRCNRLSLCQIEIHSGVFPTSCPDTPKYLEVQYHCQPPGLQEVHSGENDRMPQISDNMTSVWSSRETSLDSQRVQQVLDTAILR